MVFRVFFLGPGRVVRVSIGQTASDVDEDFLAAALGDYEYCYCCCYFMASAVSIIS